MPQVEEIAKTKMPDLNAESLDAAVQIILGTDAVDGHRDRRKSPWAIEIDRLQPEESAAEEVASGA